MQLKCLKDQNFAKTVHNLTSKLDELDFFDSHKAMCGSRIFFLRGLQWLFEFSKKFEFAGRVQTPLTPPL